MLAERGVSIVTDSGSSIRPEESIAEKLNVTILPLDIIFFKDGEPVSVADLDLKPDEFYERMAASNKLPKTSGAVTARALDAYNKLSQDTDRIVSVHLTSKHSAIYGSALAAAEMAKERKPELLIEVIDSQNLSLGAWFVTETAARLAQEGASLKEIKQEKLEVIPKIETYAALSTLDNIIAGGRVSTLQGLFATALKINPVLKVKDGSLTGVARPRTFSKAKKAMIERVKLEDAEIVRMAVMHANAPETAEEVRQALYEFYDGAIDVFEAGPVLGVHAGPGTVGVSFQKA
jgi:DegV family protein with EDD domain